MALIARGQATITTLNDGIDGYTINSSRRSYVVSTDKDGKVVTAITTSTVITAFKGQTSITPVIGALPAIAGCTLSKSGTTVTIIFNTGTSLSENGIFDIPLTVDGKSVSVSFSYAKARKGDTGSNGPAGIDANLLDWVKDWDTNKTVIGQSSVITPKIFAGIKNANGTITGIALGNFDLTTINASGVVATEKINGFYGFKDGHRTFFIDNTGSAQLGRGNQFIKYNAATGKVEFGSDVSLNWTNAANSALTSAKSYADTKKAEAISAAATDATTKANAAKEIAQQANDLAGQKVRYIRDWLNGSTANTGNHWVQIMAIDKSGTNIALSKSVSGATTNNRITNGDINTTVYASGSSGLQHVIIDLGAVYEIVSVKVWHYYADGRIYHDTRTECSVDKSVWFTIFNSATEGKYKETANGIVHYVNEYDRTALKTLRAQETADAITNTANDQKWSTKLTYIDANGIFTGTLSANTVNALKINASQITAGVIDVARINVDSLKATLITAANINALTLTVNKGTIGGWNIDSDSIYRGTKNNTANAYTAASGAITIGSNGIRGFKWKLDSNGTGALAGGNILWDAAGNVTFGASVSLNWTNAANSALTSAKTYADTKKTEAISAAATDAQTKANQAKTDAINTASTDATNKVNNIQIGARNLITLAKIGGTADAGKFGDNTGRYKDISSTQWRIQNFTQSLAGYYSISFWAKANIAGKIAFDICDQNSKTLDITTDWTFIKLENLNVTSHLVSPYYGFIDLAKASGSTITNLYISNLKIEYGTKCTSYSDAPEDVDSSIAKVKTDAATDALAKANQAKTDAINAAATDTTNKINALQIGGSNLLNNSGNWRTVGWNSGINSNGGGYTIDNTVLYNGKPTLKTLVGGGLNHNWVKLDNNVEYTYSAMVRCNETITGNGSTPLHYHSGLNNVNQTKISVIKYDTSVVANIWKRIYITFKLTGDADSFRPFFYRGTNGTTTYWLAYIKLERGNVATDWAPSASDMAQNIAEAKQAGTNAQTVADAITKKANDEKWETKLTYIDANGIYTGTLSANTVNAVRINASQITAGTIDAARINVDALKASLITAANIEALTLNVIKGKIGGWSIGSDSITIGSTGTVGAIPIHLRNTTTGSGAIFSGGLKLYGLSLLWYRNQNAGHIVFGQVASNGSAIRDGFVGIQMMAWDGTEYFCLSANSKKADAKEIYNRIAGWAFDNTRIWKNNVSLSADGSITNGNLWQINNNGSGRLANGNIIWDAAGVITFGASVSLNWTNAANNALTSAKSYADTKKTEAINSAATDATTKMNSAKVDGILYCKGTGLNKNANRLLTLNGVSVYNTSGRGLQLTTIRRSDLVVLSNVCYDVYGDAAKRTEFVTALNALNDTVIIVLTSYDAIILDTTMTVAVTRCGGSGVQLNGRFPYVLVGIPGLGKGNGIEVYRGTEANAPFAEVTTKIVSGVPQGINSINARALTLTDDTITALGGSSFPKLTKIDSTGIYTGTLTATQITAGTINAARIDVASLKTTLITAANIDALTLNATKGKIGGWSIGSDTITAGTIGGVGAMPMQIRSSSAGSGYVYTGNYKPYGITMTWHQSSNAGHIVFGQIMATGNTVRTGFIGIQMLAWDNTEYFCLSANYTKSGGKEVYNRIAGWAFDNTRIWKNNVSLGADGSIANGNLWQINNNGSGRLANGNIVWDAAGNVTFGSSVSLNWTNAANNALTSAKTYADTKKTEAINAAATDATTKSDAAKELAQAMAFGKMLYRDPIFYNGNNGINVYNNSSNGTVTITRTADNNAPNDSKQVLVIKNTGASSPNCGGFHFSTVTAYRKILITRIIAKIPVGRNIAYHSNSIGTGGTQKWLTPVAGTGDWYEYICKVSCGTASFSSTNFFSITGAVGTAAAPVEWRVAYATVFDLTSTEKYVTTIDANGIYTGTIRANQIQVDSALVVGGSTYNGSVSVRDAANAVKVTLDRNGINAVGGVIGGWTIASNQISKNSVILSSDGSIVNGTKWKFANDGSGFVANNNFSWTAAGAVTITGTVNATAGMIGGFTISGNKLTNKAADSALIFNSLSGASYVSINESTYTLLAMRADSARTAISIQTYATGARGISIIANAGSTYAVESYGPHQFGQRYGEKWNAPGVLFSALVKRSSTLYQQWGNGLTVTSFQRTGTGYFVCKHNLGHTQYIVVTSPYWDHSSNGHSNSYVRVEYINAYDFVLRVVNADNGSQVDTNFTFAVIGRNAW